MKTPDRVAYSPSPAAQGHSERHLMDSVRVLYKRRWIVIPIFLIIFVVGVVNAMRLVHYLATVGGGLFLIVHVYLGTVAYPGTLGAMLTGRVSSAWAKLHHPRWRGEESGP